MLCSDRNFSSSNGMVTFFLTNEIVSRYVEYFSIDRAYQLTTIMYKSYLIRKRTLCILTDNQIRMFEKQSGLIRLLIYLNDNPPTNVQSIVYDSDIYPNIMYPSIWKVKELGLIKGEIDNSKYPLRTILSLTEKGKLVAQKLKEIEEILKENKP